jgi:hypothetical protein
MSKRYNFLSRRYDALKEQTQAICSNLDADGIKGWGGYKINTQVLNVMTALTCPSHGGGRISYGVILLNWRTLDEANA